MEVRKGYKQTEIGIIPDDWEVVSAVNTCVKIQDGTHFSPKISGNDFLYVTSKNIRFGYLDLSTASWIDAAQHEAIYRRCDVKKGDLLLTKDGANTGNAALNTINDEFSLLSSVAFLRFNPSKHCAAYFLQQVLSSQGQRQIQDAMSGNAITRLTLAKINKLRFPVPPTLAEQETIAAAFSDADALIEALEQLLVKKRQVKQGAMQELLTGKRRLPGFEKKNRYKETEIGVIPEDWVPVSMLEICDDKDGSIKIGPFGSQLKREYLVSSGYKVYGQENVYVQNMEIGDRYLTKEHFQKLRSCELLPGDFIVSMMGTIGQCMIVPDGIQQGIIDSHLIRIRLNPKVVVPKYLSYYYSSKLVFDQISRLQVGGIMAGLSSSIIKQIFIGLPSSIEEQNAIAEILSEMDVEIAALEGKLVKARQVKQGMMQELLTGRIRLL